MIDKIWAKRGLAKYVYKDGLAINNVVEANELHNPDGHDLHVLFPPWHGAGKFYDRLIRRLIGGVTPY